MSGDVQPKKRKDKKRKKEDSTEQIPTQFQPPPTPNLNDDVNIHVHKDEGTGGGICAKIVFFLLFSALAVVIGLILTEHRGLTDLDTVDTESRFAQIFEGWTDNSHDDHDDDDHIVSSLEDDDHDHEEESHEVEEDHDEHEDEEDDHAEEASEEHSQAEDEEEEATEEEEENQEAVESEEVEESTQNDEEEEEEEENEVSEEPQEEDEEEEENESNTVQSAEEEEEEQEEDEAVNDDDEEEEEAADNDEEEEEEEPNEEGSEEQAQSEEQAASEEEQDKVSTEDAADEEANEEVAAEEEEEAQEGEEGENQDTSKMVIKIGVGVALLVVAHVVLVRKWKSESPASGDNSQSKQATAEAPPPDLSRRNTIVVPPAFQDIEQDIDDNADEEEYSDEDEGEIESEEEPEKLVKTKYQELRTTYTRSLTPESEPEYQAKQPQQQQQQQQQDDEEYEDEDEEVEEEEEEEDEEEAEEDDVEEPEEVAEEESDVAEEEEEEYEKEEEDDDLLERLEAKYGKLQLQNKQADEFDEQFSSWKRVNVHGNEPEESDSDRQSDVDAYEYENVTNKEDSKIKEKIDEAQKNIQNNAAYAIKLFDVLLKKNPKSPRSLYGKAQALDRLADQRRSNEILQQAILTYLLLLDVENVPNALFEAAADRCINRIRFIGHYNRAIMVHEKLIAQFPNEPKYRNELAVSYLTMNRVSKARAVLEETLSSYPNDGFALVHYGFILKTTDNDLVKSIPYLKRGIASRAPGVIDGRFYFHLGDALARLGRNAEAMSVYEEGVRNKLFPSKFQRSLYNVQRLKAQPWWSKEETKYQALYAALEANWRRIRREGLAVLTGNGHFQSESENLKDTGDWKQYELFARGQKNEEHCKKCPFTCKIIESVADASGCRRGQTKFSVMHPGTHVWPHCGPTNCRLRVHLGLKVPPHTYIRVADEIRSWEDGKVIIFDDSFEHEVWHNGTTFRLVLIVDVWHPDLTSAEKRSLSPI